MFKNTALISFTASNDNIFFHSNEIYSCLAYILHKCGSLGYVVLDCHTFWMQLTCNRKFSVELRSESMSGFEMVTEQFLFLSYSHPPFSEYTAAGSIKDMHGFSISNLRWQTTLQFNCIVLPKKVSKY